MSLNVDASDIDDIRRKINRDVELVRGTQDEIMDETRQELEYYAEEEAPIGKTAGPEKYPGQLRDSISSLQSGDEIAVEPDELVAPYAKYVIEGTGPSLGRYVPGIGRVKDGVHPGTPPNPFMQRAAERLTSGKLAEIIRRAINRLKL